MSIRAATEGDIDAIRRVTRRSWELDYRGILSGDAMAEGLDGWYARDQLAELLASDRSLLLVAERGETVVGFAHATESDEDDGEGFILGLYVHPDHRRKNVGRELLERTCAELADRGVERINAVALAESESGNAFFERLGFELVDERETTIGGDSPRENKYALDYSELSTAD